MCPAFIDPGIEENFKKWVVIYPQPIALSLARLLSSRTPQDTVDHCFKTAEVCARYIAACALASFAARNNAGSDGETIQQLAGNISFGTFEQIINQISRKNVEHPLKSALFVYPNPQPNISGSGPQQSPSQWLGRIVELRDDLGHSLSAISEPRARTILRDEHLPDLLHGILKSFEHLLSYPLFVIDEQRIEHGEINAQILWLMGESKDPIPEGIQLSRDIRSIRHPYIAIDQRILNLCPSLIWDSVPRREYYGLLFMDGILDRAINYQSLDPEEVELNGSRVTRINSICLGQRCAHEEVVLSDRRQFVHEWRSVQRRRIDAYNVLQGRMPWEKFSPDNLRWYAKRLAPDSDRPSRAIIQHELFDGRETFEKDEIFQAILLFGKEAEVKRIINRNIIEIRSPQEGQSRGGRLLESRKNIIQSIRACVDVFARTLNMSDASLDSLDNTSGTPDYIALREALINQFIHQDYKDSSAPAQIIIAKENVTFFNMGYSLISTDSLIQGWKSQPRNPLIARALRLIGFAELAGSGLQELQRVWRTANQRPPIFTSNKDENNFTLVLDWRPVKNTYDEFWKAKIGVGLNQEQALILNLTADPSGITLEQGVSGSGLSFEATRTIFQHLMTQALIEQREGRYYVKEYLRQLVGDIR